MSHDPVAIAKALTGAQAATLRAIWPASSNLEMTWPLWASRADVDELQRQGLIDEKDFTDLGRDVLGALAALSQQTDTPQADGAKDSEAKSNV